MGIAPDDLELPEGGEGRTVRQSALERPTEAEQRLNQALDMMAEEGEALKAELYDEWDKNIMFFEGRQWESPRPDPLTTVTVNNIYRILIQEAALLADYSPTYIIKARDSDKWGALASVLATIAEAIYAAIEQGADVINLSLGADTPSATLERAIDYAYEQRVVVVAAAGNKPDAVTFPASYARTISVGGAVADGTALAEFSSRITRVDLVAPAVNNLTTTWSDAGPGWGTVSGTSFSAPIVSGTVALMRSVQPELTVEQVRRLLVSTARPLGPAGQPGAGAGLLDAGAAVRQALLPSLARTWQVADRPVSEGIVRRTWLWGPYAFAVRTEPYNESPQGTRLVAYYDKARMEVTEPEAPQDTSWYVTNGLLVRELITGQVQVGDTTFLPASPAQIPVAGDPNDTLGPTYASFARLLAVPPPEVETVIVQTIDRGGQVGADERLAGYGVLAGPLIPETNHRVASVFWEYLNSQGVLYQGGGYVTGALFDPAFYATGFPITEAYWTRAIVAGVVRDVLVQCFERRCLTYTPANPEGWQVEMGNVGQHYYRWRYGEPPYEPSPEDPMAVALRLN